MVLPIDKAKLIRLGAAPRGYRGFIHHIESDAGSSGLPPEEIERRLLELGFIEGAEVSILHEGPLRRDPIAVRINGATVALRRKEAMAILIHESHYDAQFKSFEDATDSLGWRA
ncbi:ferrous iron transport protein A [Brucella oryzae]|uniref:FeoA family protein n=1 Tax=Brucella oryzae TaxID=335286 RepID=UPI001B82F23D|nr:ferrous iron transport protein A [Brucella oryzae]